MSATVLQSGDVSYREKVELVEVPSRNCSRDVQGPSHPVGRSRSALCCTGREKASCLVYQAHALQHNEDLFLNILCR